MVESTNLDTMQEIEEILEYIKRKDTNILQLSKETKIPADRIYSWRRGKGSPKAEDTQLLLAWGKEFGILANPELKEVPNKDAANKDAISETTFETLAAANKLLAEAHVIFAEAQRNFSEAQKNFSESNKMLVETNMRLTSNQSDASTNVGAKRGSIALATTAAMQDVLFEKLAPLLGISKEDLDATLRSKVSEYRNLHAKDRTQSDLSKSRT